MEKFNEAKEILIALGMPKKQQAHLCCYSLLAMLNISPDNNWSEATNEWIRIHDILQFAKEKYRAIYAENSRETFRKQAMHQFRNAALIEDNGKPTNSPNYRYRVTKETLELIQSFGTVEWDTKLEEFKKSHESLIDMYSSKKKMNRQYS